MPDQLSEKERALIEAARREAAALASPPPARRADAATPTPTDGIAPVPAPLDCPVAPIRPATAAKSSVVAAGPDAIARRIALLMESERQEKARRLKQHQRWKVGAIGVFVVLAGWSALTLISQLRH